MKQTILSIFFVIISMVAKAQPSVNSEANVSEEGVRADTRPNMDFANVEYYIQFWEYMSIRFLRFQTIKNRCV